MAKPSNYWDKRALRRLTEAEKQGEAYSKRIQKIYEQAQKNIQRDIENIYANYSKATGMDVQSLKTLLTKTQTQKLWDELKAKGLDQYVKGNYKARITRLEQLQAQLYAKVKEIYPQEQNEHTECFNDVLNNTYYKSIYDTQMGTGYDFAFSNLDDNLVKSVLNERWSGKNYSQRIWGNTDILAESVSEIVGGALLSGQSYAKTSRQIRERFNVGKYYADRLVRTECNHFHNQADAMAYEEMDVDKYVFMAVLDSRTSDICQRLDNKVIDLKDKKEGVNFPPMHVNCRSTTRVYMGEEIEKTLKRRARNPITNENEIVDNISYQEWAKKHGLSRELTNNGKGVTITSGARILNPYSQEGDDFAKLFYAEVKSFSTDINKIATNTGYNEEDIEKIKKYLFYTPSFKPDCAIAHSWQRLILGKDIKEHDYLLLKHELYEMQIKKENPSIAHIEAHTIATHKYNYQKAVDEYYGNLKKRNKKK